MTRPCAIIFGAAGFIGRHTARTFAGQGCEVIGIGNGNWSAEEAREYGIERWINASIMLEGLNQLKLPGPIDCVIHCAGSGAVSFSYTEPWQDFQRATVTTAAILEWIRNQVVRRPRLVLVSSAAVYGDQGDSDATETSTRSPISPYGFHKLTAEILCESYSRFFDIPVSIVRLFSVYGEGLRKQLLWDALSKFQSDNFQFFGTGNELRDWIHIDDAAALLVRAGLTEQSTFEIYNGGFEHATTRNVLSRLSVASGYDKTVLFNGETHKGNPHRLTSCSQNTMRLLKWSPSIRLEEGLSRYVKWVAKGHD